MWCWVRSVSFTRYDSSTAATFLWNSCAAGAAPADPARSPGPHAACTELVLPDQPPSAGRALRHRAMHAKAMLEAAADSPGRPVGSLSTWSRCRRHPHHFWRPGIAGSGPCHF